ncbi:MAG: sigma 54-interacting transcriptional regulator, partial [Candidatus Kariarchaeaceae archaeon]
IRKRVLRGHLLPRMCNKPSFRYHSFPYNFDYHQERTPNFISSYKATLFADSNTLEEFEVIVDDPRINDFIGLSEGYCSYFFGDQAVGPAMIIWWFREEKISDLIDIENETGLKVFPRYILYDPLYPAIETFCWDYYLELELASSADLVDDSELFFIRMKQKMNPLQRQIKRNYDFLDILTPPYRDAEEAFFDYNESLDVAKDEESVIENNEYKEDLPQESLNEEHYIARRKADEVWRNYHKEYIEELLSIMSDRFISKYIHLTQRTDFSFSLVKELQYGYLKQLYDSIESRYKRAKAKSRSLEEQRKELEEIEKQFPAFKKIITKDYEMNEHKREAARRSRSKKKHKVFLILGETGTGKELFAGAIHQATGRREEKGKKRTLVDVNVKTITPTLFQSQLFGYEKGAHSEAKERNAGLFEQASGGTMFWDEIGELPLELQDNFLRVLERREIRRAGATKKTPIDCTIIFATSKDLREEVEKGNFRRDLYMRINHREFTIPPLRKRKGDILPLVQHFIKENAREFESPDLVSIGVTDDGIELLEKYEWPGNVRELENVISKIMDNRSDYNETGDITYSELRQEIPDFHLSKKSIPKPRKGRKKRPSDEELIRLENEEYSRVEVAEKFGVTRETATRWYSDMRKKSDQGD